MPKKSRITKPLSLERPKRAQLSAEESLQRMKSFSKRKGRFIAAIREGKDRGLSA